MYLCKFKNERKPAWALSIIKAKARETFETIVIPVLN